MSQERRNRFRSSLEKSTRQNLLEYLHSAVISRTSSSFQGIDADLMMEQSVVYGLLGYFEFLTPHRLAIIKRRQRPKGYHGEIENEEELDRKQGWKTMRKLLVGKELSGTF